MNTFLVTFEDGNTIITSMNANLDEAKSYYVGHSFQFGDTEQRPYDMMIKAVSVADVHQ
jgi:hypothetical protein